MMRDITPAVLHIFYHVVSYTKLEYSCSVVCKVIGLFQVCKSHSDLQVSK